MNGKCTTQQVCDNLLEYAVNTARSDESEVFGNLSCTAAKAVATDMTYNMGKSSMSGFSHFISDMKSGNYK